MIVKNKNLLVISSSSINGTSVGGNFLKLYLDHDTRIEYEHFRIPVVGEGKLPYRLSTLPLISDLLLLQWFRNTDGLLRDIKTKTQKGYDAVWIILSSLEIILIAPELIKDLSNSGIKVTIGIWDSFDYLVSNRRVSPATKGQLYKSYSSAISLCSAVSGISEGMKHYLEYRFNNISRLIEKKFFLLPFPILIGTDDCKASNSDSVRVRTLPSSTIDIVFAGSVYCWREWNTFIQNLDQCKWTCEGKTIRLHVYGRPNLKNIFNTNRPNIIYYNPVSHQQLVREISRYDFAYLPYFFSKYKKVVATTSLPGKLSLYIEARLPTLFHGPKYSEAYRIINKYKIGVQWSGSESDDIRHVISKLLKINDEGLSCCVSDYYSISNYQDTLFESF